jgi:GLPGLI family protein
MKNKALFLLAIFSFGPLFGQEIVTPDYVAYYEFHSPSDTLPLTLAPAEDCILLAYGSESRFMAANAYFNDSMQYEFGLKYPHLIAPKTQEDAQELFDKLRQEASQWKKKVNCNYAVIKRSNENTVINKLNIAAAPQYLEFPVLNGWRIGTAKDSIAGLSCQQATISYGGREYVAWFAPAIPIPDGPYVFSGLPGLIVKVTDSHGWYTFELKSFDQKPHPHHWKADYLYPLSKSISRESYVSQRWKYKNNPTFYGSMGQDAQDVLRQRKRYAHKYHLLIERH